MNVHIKRIDNIGYIQFLLCFNAGLVYEPEDKYGITHLLEHMLFRGIGRYNYNELENCFSNMGTEVYAKTGYDYMLLSFSVLSSEIEKSIEYLNELFLPPNWSSTDLKKEKEIVKHEIALKGIDFSKRIKVLYNNSFMNKSVMGNISTVERISLKELKKYYSEVVKPNNCTLFISGDISEHDHNKLLKFLSGINNIDTELKYSAKNSLLPDHAFNRQGQITLEYDYCEYSDLYINFDVKKEYQAAARFIQYFLSGYTSPISEALIDNKGYSYELYSALDEWKDFSVILFTISCKYDCLCSVISDMFSALSKAIHNFDYAEYEKISAFHELEKRKIASNPEKSNEDMFYRYFYGIDEIPAYDQIILAMKEIFSKNNFSLYSTYSVKRKDVMNSISKCFACIGDEDNGSKYNKRIY